MSQLLLAANFFAIAELVFVGRQAPADEPTKTYAVSAFGAKGDGRTDDWWAFQQAINAADAGHGGVVLVPSSNAGYRISQALRLRDKVIVRVSDDQTRIYCTGDASGQWKDRDPTGADARTLEQWPLNGCLVLGAYTSVNYERAPAWKIMPVAAKALTIHFGESDSARSFSSGDIVVIESESRFTIGKHSSNGYSVPSWAQIDRVTDVSIGANSIDLQYPVQTSLATGQLRKLTNTQLTMLVADGSDSAIPMWATYEAGVIGGVWDSGSTRPFAAGGGALECRVSPQNVLGFTGVGYANVVARCRMSVGTEDIFGSPLELGHNSHDNLVTVSHVLVEKTSGQGWYFAADEASRDNIVHISSIDVGSSAGSDLIHLERTSGNCFEVDSAVGDAISRSTIGVYSYLPTEDQPPTSDNSIIVYSSNIKSQLRYVTLNGSKVVNNTLMVGSLSGLTTDSGGRRGYFMQAGAGNIVKKLLGENGGTPLDSGSPHCASGDTAN